MKLNAYDTQKAFDYENGYFITADDRRIAKFMVHFRDIVETRNSREIKGVSNV
ncbi:hypothetical protein [Helicobacter turcicus]|uniref:Uncharacterized protein n=1 Tax=Helicobacter turcicus TaxID=2867412 RepID=A0ABS7JQ30_9HELI|nr:hypothetical protein [Helicobacter turcicus]MBX7491519.1 hypothetical protein [Helicobacter turcicus]MBX7546376.1 hypothetical protein [Helicobacter turcicus]